MYDAILLPTDGSDGTTGTLEHAIHIAKEDGATIHALYVVDRRLYMAAESETKAEVKKSLGEEGERAIDDVRVRAEEAGLDVEAELIDGIPHREIADYVDREGIDLVTMGTHGRTGRDRVANLGSVTERVVESVETPVLVVDIGE
ncbi:MAG: universal stress protein [Haloarculaceae archaeon]